MKTQFWIIDDDGVSIFGCYEGDESGYEIRRIINDPMPYHLYELVMYGGEPIFYGCYNSAKEAVDIAERWT